MTHIAHKLRFLFAALLLLAAYLNASAQLPAPVEKPAGDALLQGKPLLDPQPKAAIIRLDAEVDDIMLKSIQRRLDIARRAGCSLIIFEMDTFGGQVTSAIDISKLIKSIPEKDKMHTVAWVHDKAYSAGAMISVACQHIVMDPQGTLGLCAPIAVSTNRITGQHELVPLPDTERAKMTDPIRQEFDDSARQNGYDQTLLEAMVLMPIQIHEMRDAAGHLKYVDTVEKNRLLDLQTDLPGGGKEHPWKFVRTIDDDKQILTVGAPDAINMNLSSATIDTDQQLKAVLNIQGDLLLLKFSLAERATVFLTEWFIRLMLFVGLLVFAWLEFSHPGFSLFGIASLICLILLVGAPFLTGLAQIWEIALIVIGLGIIITDLLVFGGIGMLAIPGFILMAVGLVASFIPEDPNGHFFTSSTSLAAAETGLGVLVGGTFLAGIAFYFFAKYLYLTPGFNRLQLVPAGTRRSSNASGTPDIRDAADRPAQDAVFVGAIGKATSDLRPSGKARFGDHLIEVVSHGSYIPRDTEITILEISDLRIVVKPYTPAPAESPPPATPDDQFP